MIHLENVLKMSWRRLQDVVKSSWRSLEDAFQDVLKMSWRRFCQTSWGRLGKTYGRDEYVGLDEDVLKTSSEEVRVRRTYSSWWRRYEDEDERRLQDVFIKTNISWDHTINYNNNNNNSNNKNNNSKNNLQNILF